MSDLLLSIEGEGVDLVLEGGDLVLDPGLATPVLVSVFSDARADQDELRAPDQDPRGWWAEDPADPFGSKLWIRLPGKLTAENVELARQDVRASLEWLIAEDIAAAVDVTAERGAGREAYFVVRITRGGSRGWPELWREPAPVSLSLGNARLQVLPFRG